MEILIMTLMMGFTLGADVPGDVYFQAHRGGIDEVPENTLVAYEHAWSIPGAVPEADLATTQDGVFVCMHDDTPRRTTTAPDPWKNKKMSSILLEEVRRWDAGSKFRNQYAGEKVPTLEEVFSVMKGKPERQIYLDIKDADTKTLTEMIKANGLEKQIIFVHGDVKTCAELKKLYEGARTMTWLSGKPKEIQEKYEDLAKTGFDGLSQLQFHLRSLSTEPEIVYALDDDFLKEAVKGTRAAGVELQLRPLLFNPASLRKLIDLGVHWYVTDAPKAFSEAVNKALAMPAKP
jgi:glycerophosphoryl diester phosphodiesterase